MFFVFDVVLCVIIDELIVVTCAKLRTTSLEDELIDFSFSSSRFKIVMDFSFS